jgi:hypothetical protein
VYEAKTKPTASPFGDYLAGITDETRRRECIVIAGMMERVTGCGPVMWGASIVGFDSYHYRYASGHEGDACLVGFSSGKAHLSLYLIAGYEAPATKELLARLGKHKLGKACLYIKRLSEVDLAVLEMLVVASVADTRGRYPRT